ncbi:histidine kinase [Streptomyces sp. CMB-StM0423]|uniref:histidine kinase n=1 Tax=Streptomyces sp. CMB-StM0423 TaxID=2059884 RepID=UPI0018FE4EAD|nr:histidine kinase [Streptomyces sp. CMB-StM0423]
MGLAGLVAFPGLVQISLGDWREDARDEPGADPAALASLPVAVPWLLWAGMVLAMPWRRRYPFTVFCALAAVTYVHDSLHLAIASVTAIGVALYNVALRLPLSRLPWVAAILAVVIAADALREPPDSYSQAYVPMLAITATIVMAGITVRTRREYVASLLNRAHRLEVERDQRARLAAAAERARIAHEMHDIVAHNLSVIVGVADGGLYAARGGGSPAAGDTGGPADRSVERPAQALEAISATGREALGELRRLLGVLHEQHSGAGPAHLAPQPGLAELDPLLRRVREAGLPVRCTVRGDSGTLSEGRQLTVYRIVQEALTNTLKHAGAGATAAVRLNCGTGGVEIEVTDTGAPAGRDGEGRGRNGRVPVLREAGDGSGLVAGAGEVPGTVPRAGAGSGSPARDGSAGGWASPGGGDERRGHGGRGIAGMRERAAVYGGTLDAGPAARGWRVYATLPPVADPAPAGASSSAPGPSHLAAPSPGSPHTPVAETPRAESPSPAAASHVPSPAPPRKSPPIADGPAPAGRPRVPGPPPEAAP